MIPKILKNELWTKNWSGNWSLLFGSFYGDVYTKGLDSLVGRHFENNLIIFEKGLSSNYLIQTELKEFCTFLAQLVKKDSGVPKKWADQVIRKTDEILPLMAKLEKKKRLSKDDYIYLESVRIALTPPNFAIKKVIDFLPHDLVTKYLDTFSHVRVYTEPVYNETDRILKKIMRELLPKTISDQELLVLTKEEFTEYLISKKLPKSESLQTRYSGYALLYNTTGQARTIEGKDFAELMKIMVGKLAVQEINGMSAYKGKIVGRVRIVFDPSNVNEFKKGDILVAGMTRPEYLFLMEKSGAFITDAGGLLSHAAIVAREMKKPCIVGTNVATKVLKDGDMVEVDADKGVVKIIKKA